MAKLNMRWTEQKLGMPRGSKPASRYYLFNANGLMIGRVEPTGTGFYQGWVGRPGVEVPGVYGSPEEAKKAVEGCFKQ